MSPSVSRSVDIAAPADRVWEIVSDLPGMGSLSPESTGGVWADGAGPALDAVFRGTNAQGSRTWSTRSRVVRCEPGREFAFEVSSVGLPVAQWSYELAATPDGGCRVTETWQDRRGRLVGLAGRLMTGVQDREAFTANSIETTLARVKAKAETTSP